MRRVEGLGSVAGAFDALYCDVWGVVHDGVAAFPEAVAALIRFRRERGPVIFVTNSPRPAGAAHEQLSALGCPREAYDAVASSGEATRAEIAKLSGAPIHHLGPARDAPLFEGLKVRFTALDEAAAIVCTGLFDDETEEPADYAERLEDAAERELPMICANPDLAARRGDKIIPCAGALADLYEALGGRVARAGKPYPPIYDLAASHLDGEHRVLCVGDGPLTDLEGAKRRRLPALYIHGGLHERDAPFDRVAEMLATQGQSPDYCAMRLRW